MKGLTIRVIHLWPKPQHTGTSCNELGGNCSGFRRTLSNLLPALLGTCYQHYQITNSIFQLDLLDKEEFTLRILEPRGFEPLFAQVISTNVSRCVSVIEAKNPTTCEVRFSLQAELSYGVHRFGRPAEHEQLPGNDRNISRPIQRPFRRLPFRRTHSCFPLFHCPFERNEAIRFRPARKMQAANPNHLFGLKLDRGTRLCRWSRVVRVLRKTALASFPF